MKKKIMETCATNVVEKLVSFLKIKIESISGSNGRLSNENILK